MHLVHERSVRPGHATARGAAAPRFRWRGSTPSERDAAPAAIETRAARVGRALTEGFGIDGTHDGSDLDCRPTADRRRRHAAANRGDHRPASGSAPAAATTSSSATQSRSASFDLHIGKSNDALRFDPEFEDARHRHTSSLVSDCCDTLPLVVPGGGSACTTNCTASPADDVRADASAASSPSAEAPSCRAARCRPTRP